MPTPSTHCTCGCAKNADGVCLACELRQTTTISVNMTPYMFTQVLITLNTAVKILSQEGWTEVAQDVEKMTEFLRRSIAA